MIKKKKKERKDELMARTLKEKDHFEMVQVNI
jgi:hypothetical protein